VNLPIAQYPDQAARQRFVDRTLAALRDTPGIETATVSSDIPLNGGIARFTRGLIAKCLQPTAAPPLRVTISRLDICRPGESRSSPGRAFDEHDVAGGRNVCLISQTGAKKVFPNENPIGKTLLVTSNSTPAEIVGIVGDVRSQRIAEVPEMEFYLPLAQENFPFLNIAVRSNLKVDAITKLVQSAVTNVDPGVAIAIPQMMDTIVAQARGQARLMMWLLGIFAGVAVLLASIGIYGAVAYSVEQRTGEIGVRMALGAQTRDVLRLIVSQGMRPVVIGLAIGIASAFALGRLLTSQLYEVSARNPALLAASTILLAAIALVACLVPARRAARVDPIQALRAQ
jgi:putative ABC transport system permease protein